jgi:hypothetical protein
LTGRREARCRTERTSSRCGREGVVGISVSTAAGPTCGRKEGAS